SSAARSRTPSALPACSWWSAGSTELLPRGHDPGHQAPLHLGEQRVPDVEHENDAGLVAVIARLVLDAVVEHPGLPHLLIAVLVAHAVAAALRQDERPLHDEPYVRGSRVR